MCGRDGADDIVQDTFLEVLRGPGGYDSTKGSVGNYLFGIARHFVLKRLTSRELVTFELTDADECDPADLRTPTVLDSLSRAETVRAVRTAIATLPAPYREIVVLCELQEMSYVDAAAIVQCPIGTVRSRLHRAKALLVSKLAEVRVEAGLGK